MGGGGVSSLINSLFGESHYFITRKNLLTFGALKYLGSLLGSALH